MPSIGPDYASVDRNQPPDFSKAKAAGARFVIPRAIFGRSLDGTGKGKVFRDPVWERDKDRIRAAGLLRGAYLYLCYPRAGMDTPTPEEQVAAYVAYVDLIPFVDYVPMFDVEQPSTLDAPDYYDWTLRAARALRAHYGIWPGMYTSARVWSEYLKHHSPGQLLHCPLWLAKPWPWAEKTPVHLDGAQDHTATSIPEFGVDNWWLYQYQGDALGWPGFSATVDANRFHTIGQNAASQPVLRRAQVVWLQQRLEIAADGIFGPQTTAAVQALQVKHGLAADGIVGPATFAPLSWSNPAPL